MSLSDLKKRHMQLISLYSTRYAVRGGTGLVFIMLVLLCGLMTAHLIITPVEQTREASREYGVSEEDYSNEDIVNELIEVARPVVEWVLTEEKTSTEEEEEDEEAGREWTSFLLDENPALLSAVLLIMLFASPFLVTMGAFNQFSGDVQTRGIRYQLLRAERTNIFFGRFLGAALFTILVMALLIAIISLYIGLKLQIYEMGALVGWSLRGFLALSLVCLPYVALCAWISSAIDSPFGSLTISSVIVGAVPLFALIGRHTWEPMAYVNYLLPWGVQNHLLHPSSLHLVGSVAACLGYTALFLLLGHRHFSKRDL